MRACPANLSSDASVPRAPVLVALRRLVQGPCATRGEPCAKCTAVRVEPRRLPSSTGGTAQKPPWSRACRGPSPRAGLPWPRPCAKDSGHRSASHEEAAFRSQSDLLCIDRCGVARRSQAAPCLPSGLSRGVPSVAQWGPERRVPHGHLVGRAARWSGCADVARRDLHFQLERRSCQTEAGWCGRSGAIGTSDVLRMACGQTEAPGLRTAAGLVAVGGVPGESLLRARTWESLLVFEATSVRSFLVCW
jgi:hypothetical protein